MTELTPELITRILSVIDRGLIAGLGSAQPGNMCVEAAICYSLGEPHGDKPSCVDALLRNLKISLNDLSGWSSAEARAAGMRRLAIAQLGTDNWFSGDSRAIFVKKLPVAAVSKWLPPILMEESNPRLRELGEKCAVEPTKENLLKINEYLKMQHGQPGLVSFIVVNLICSWEAGFIHHTYTATTESIVYSILKMLDLIERRIRSKSAISFSRVEKFGASTHDQPVAKEIFAAKTQKLRTICEDIVQILVEMETPGSKFLYLCPFEE